MIGKKLSAGFRRFLSCVRLRIMAGFEPGYMRNHVWLNMHVLAREVVMVHR